MDQKQYILTTVVISVSIEMAKFSQNMHTKSCKQCKSQFTVYDEDLKFYAKMDVPEPTLCPQCRFLQRVAHRNHHNLYQRKCDLCKQDIISIYSADAPYTIYCPNCWWGDSWDAMKYGKEINFNRSFFEQYSELALEVPRLGLFNKNTENAEYNNDIGNAKNCYLNSVVYDSSENVYYSFLVMKSRDVCDSSIVYNSELVYGSSDCRSSYQIVASQQIENCRDCYFSFDLRSCKSCLLCFGLRDQQYCVRNKQVTKTEYDVALAQCLKDKEAFQLTLKESERSRKKYPHRPYTIKNSEGSVGDSLFNCKKCYQAFDMQRSEDCRYFYSGFDNKNCVDCYGGIQSESCYSASNFVNGNNVRFSKFVWDNHDISYCDSCFNSSDLFGCVINNIVC